MDSPSLLTPDQLKDAVGELDGWSTTDGTLHRDIRFPDFASAFGFMAAMATVAAELNHHPDWSNVYSSVSIDLSTHESGGITDLDIAFARKADTMASAWSA